MKSSKMTWGYVVAAGFKSWEPEAIVNKLANLGYDTIEWTLDHFNPRSRSSFQLEKMIRTSADQGLESSQVAIFLDFVSGDHDVRQNNIELTSETIKAAAESGVSLVSIYAGPDSWDTQAPQIPTELSTSCNKVSFPSKPDSFFNCTIIKVNYFPLILFRFIFFRDRRIIYSNAFKLNKIFQLAEKIG